MYSHGVTYGTTLQNLQYKTKSGITPQRWHTTAYAILHYGMPYLWSKWRTHHNGCLSDAIEALSKCMIILNLCLFLYEGIYRNPCERLLGIRLVPIHETPSRQINFEFLNRQLLWHAFSEGVLCILPLIKPFMYRWYRGTSKIPSNGCGLCGQPWPAIPYKGSRCHHQFCYYCAASYKMERSAYQSIVTCPVCDVFPFELEHA